MSPSASKSSAGGTRSSEPAIAKPSAAKKPAAAKKPRKTKAAAGSVGLVGQAVEKLEEAGWTSGYLKPIVVARINPLRFAKLGKAEHADFDSTINKMIDGAKKFDASKVKAADIALAATVVGGDAAGES